MRLAAVGSEYVAFYTQRHGRLPPDIGEEPPIAREEFLYLHAFYDLKTCRPFSIGMSGAIEGPIPWTAIDTYGRSVLGLTGDDLGAFVRVIRAMDQEYLEESSKRAAQEAQQASRPKGGKRGR